MKDWFKKTFHRKEMTEKKSEPLVIDGIDPAPITAEPDEAEQAAQALLESLSNNEFIGSGTTKGDASEEPKGTPAYYRMLAKRMEKAHIAAVQRTTRFVAFCEQELKNPNLPMEGPGSLSLLETEIYKRIDTVEREGGELKRRWQHCLAEVTVRMMNKAATESQHTEHEKE